MYGEGILRFIYISNVVNIFLLIKDYLIYWEKIKWRPVAHHLSLGLGSEREKVWLN